MHYEVLNLDGRGPRRSRAYPMAPHVAPIRGRSGAVIGVVPEYWPAVTDVPCPVCWAGTIRWHEAGHVPGYRRCDGCGRHFVARGTAEAPVLVQVRRR